MTLDRWIPFWTWVSESAQFTITTAQAAAYAGENLGLMFQGQVPAGAYGGYAYGWIDNVGGWFDIPEPMTMSILGFGLGGLFLRRRRK